MPSTKRNLSNCEDKQDHKKLRAWINNQRDILILILRFYMRYNLGDCVSSLMSPTAQEIILVCKEWREAWYEALYLEREFGPKPIFTYYCYRPAREKGYEFAGTYAFCLYCVRKHMDRMEKDKHYGTIFCKPHNGRDLRLTLKEIGRNPL